MPPPQEMFPILSLKMATLSAFWVLAHAARRAWPLPPPGSASGGGCETRYVLANSNRERKRDKNYPANTSVSLRLTDVLAG